MLIKEIAGCERPYEKALEFGTEVLSDAELLATIIRTGSADEGSVDLANRVLDNHHIYKGLIGLNYMSRDDLLGIKGIGNIKATQLLAVAELSKRMANQRLKKGISFNDAYSVASYYQEKCKYLNKEMLYLLMFNTANMLIRETVMTVGTVNEALISTREIYIQALKHEAVNIILVHNHPSGNVEPSMADIIATKDVKDAGKLIGINLLDHIIVGYDNYFSMHERGVIL